MFNIEPSSTIEFQEFLIYNWIPNPNKSTTGLFTGFGYNPNDVSDYKTIQESNPDNVWTLLKDGQSEDDYHFYSGFFPYSEDVICYILTKESANSLNIKVSQPV